MPSAFDNKVICLIVTTATFAILKLSMIIKHQKTLGKTKKNEKTIFQESQKPWNKEQKPWKKQNRTKKMEILGWTLYLPKL